MKLLRTTNSLRAVKDQPHRYKVRTGALPVFGNPGGPALEKKFVGVVEPRVSSDGEVVSAAVETQPMKTTAAVAEEQGHAKPARISRWPLPANPFKSSRPRPTAARLAVQGELSLDKVKPVRNDLSDSDLELVAAVKKPEPAPDVVKIESELVPVVQVKALWERVRELWPGAR